MSSSAPSFATQHAAMVNGQLRPNRITHHAVLAAYAAVPRHLFAAPGAGGAAYLDQPLPLSATRTGFAPMVSAHLVQAVAMALGTVTTGLQGKTILVAAAGSGFEPVLLAHLGATVTAVEDDATLAAVATQQATQAHADAVTVVHAPVTAGYPANGPYDVLFLAAPYQTLPTALFNQLKDGGLLAGVHINAAGVAQALVATRHQGTLVEEVLLDTAGTPHPAFRAEEQFVF